MTQVDDDGRTVELARPKQRVLFDLETSDPDDVLTLCMLATHPQIELAAITVSPGSAAQIGIVRAILSRLEYTVPIGARDPAYPKPAVSPFHYTWLGPVKPAEPDYVAHDLMAKALTENGATVLLTGAPLHNLGLLLEHHPHLRIQRWVAQGGFAGDNVVAPEHRLRKFAGRTTCETFNFGSDKDSALVALSSPRILRRELVSKNVTHGVVWNRDLQDRLISARGLTRGAQLACEGMGVYLRKRPQGKLLHDPLALSALIDPSSFSWAQVEMTYVAGQWGSRPADGTATFITTAVERERALGNLFGPICLSQ